MLLGLNPAVPGSPTPGLPDWLAVVYGGGVKEAADGTAASIRLGPWKGEGENEG